MDAEGYVAVDGAWRRVAWLPSGAIKINSGVQVQTHPPGTGWRVAGRASGTSIALYRMADTGQFTGEHASMTLRDLLASNPRYLVGQTVSHEGTTWRVAPADGPGVQLEDDVGRTRVASSHTIVDENLEQLRLRVVLLVDVG